MLGDLVGHGHRAPVYGNYREWVQERIRLAHALADVLAAEKQPMIVGGDFNTPDHGYIYHLFAGEMTDAFAHAGRGWGLTFPGSTHNPISFFGAVAAHRLFLCRSRLGRRGMPSRAGPQIAAQGGLRALCAEAHELIRPFCHGQKHPSLGRQRHHFVLAFDLAFFWQSRLGAYQSEFGGHPDEAAHVVTGLFIRDALVETWHYATGGFHGSPVRIGKEFADRYYTHYPKIGLGVWPPFFYLVQSAWTWPFGASRTALLLLLCALAAALAWLVFRVVREELG